MPTSIPPSTAASYEPTTALAIFASWIHAHLEHLSVLRVQRLAELYDEVLGPGGGDHIRNRR